MRWKLFFYNNPKENWNGKINRKNNYGLKSGITPPNDHELEGFEKDIMHMAANVEFRQTERCFNPMQ